MLHWPEGNIVRTSIEQALTPISTKLVECLSHGVCIQLCTLLQAVKPILRDTHLDSHLQVPGKAPEFLLQRICDLVTVDVQGRVLHFFALFRDFAGDIVGKNLSGSYRLQRSSGFQRHCGDCSVKTARITKQLYEFRRSRRCDASQCPILAASIAAAV